MRRKVSLRPDYHNMIVNNLFIYESSALACAPDGQLPRVVICPGSTSPVAFVRRPSHREKPEIPDAEQRTECRDRTAEHAIRAARAPQEDARQDGHQRRNEYREHGRPGKRRDAATLTLESRRGARITAFCTIPATSNRIRARDAHQVLNRRQPCSSDTPLWPR